MGMMHYRPFARKARAILTERDYRAARAVLLASARMALLREEEERVEALLRELAHYDSNPAEFEPGPATDPVQSGPARGFDGNGPGRRWSDRHSREG
ncbi:MAG TPA: hypothetical protein VD791_10585 [Burkholderiales bacterium]|nr:hypothetical protein [Burkholderiales bacterium]